MLCYREWRRPPALTQADATRPFTVYEGISVRNVAEVESSGTGHNDSLEIRIAKALGKHLQFQASYLLSSQLTNAFFTGGAGTGAPSDWGSNPSGEIGPADFYQRHRFIAAGVVDLPWQLRFSASTVIASGLPVNPLTNVDNNGDGYVADLAYGFARNSFRGPIQASLDTSISRTFAFRDRMKLELRVSGFNILNRSNFIDPNDTYGNAAMPNSAFLGGVAGISNSDPARQFQFGARFIF
jgi:hypothetical protein